MDVGARRGGSIICFLLQIILDMNFCALLNLNYFNSFKYFSQESDCELIEEICVGVDLGRAFTELRIITSLPIIDTLSLVCAHRNSVARSTTGFNWMPITSCVFAMLTLSSVRS